MTAQKNDNWSIFKIYTMFSSKAYEKSLNMIVFV